MKLILLALFPIFLQAQQLQPVTSVQPDCAKFSSPIRIAGTVTMATVDNRQAACDGWVVTYSSNGFSAVSVLLQSAPLGTGGVAGTFVSFAGTIVSPFTNPATATTQGEIRATGYYPYVNVAITTTGTGYLVAEFHGYKTNPNAGTGSGGGGSGCVGTSVTPCVVDGPTAAGSPATTPPVLVAGQDSANIRVIHTNAFGGIVPGSTPSITMSDNRANTVVAPAVVDNATGTNEAPTYVTYPFQFDGSIGGSGWDRQFVCGQQVFVNLAASGNTQVIADGSAGSIRICHIHLSTSAAETIQLTTGTGAACATGNTVIDAYQNVSAIAMDFQPTAALKVATSNGLCINPSASTTLTGVIIYAQF
jgi:hypothetical protein